MGINHGVPKGAACGCNQAPEFDEGRKAFMRHNMQPGQGHNKNPYEFFGGKESYLKHYAFDIGYQAQRSFLFEMNTLLWPAAF